MIRDLQSLDDFDANAFARFSNPSVIEKDLRTLSGILQGIKSDNIINADELQGVYEWLNTCKIYENKQPYKEIITLVRIALEDFILTQEEIDNILWFCKLYTDKIGYYDAITSGVQNMLGIVKGVVIDKKINELEINYLDQWLEENGYLKNIWPYDELYNITTKIINKGSFSSDEHDAVLNFCEALVGNGNREETASLVQSLKTGYYQLDPEIDIQENLFCITGLSKKYKRREIAEQIELYGGYVSNSVTAKVNYLIVCDAKNTCWAFTCYGRKIEQAVNHRKNGSALIIVHEDDFFDCLENYK